MIVKYTLNMSNELMIRQFEPILNKHRQILTYAYNPESLPMNVPQNFVVSKIPGTSQFVIGVADQVSLYAKAFNLLDAISDSGISRNISVLIYPFDTSSDEKGDYQKFILDILKQFGLYDRIKDTVYDKSVFRTGVFPDQRETLFCDRKVEWLADYDNDGVLQTFDYAGAIKHETEHILQSQNGQPTNSLWSERKALSIEAAFMGGILNTGQLKKSQEKILLYLLQEKCGRIYSYRNGRGFEDHISVILDEGSPTNNTSSTETDDFMFGY